MDIVIISEFCEDFSITDNDRFLYLAKMLVRNSDDNKVEIVTSSFRHTTKKHRREPLAEWPFKVTFIEEPGYRKNVCIKRFLSHYIWGKNVIKYIRHRDKKPDVVYCAVPSLTGPYLVAKFCEKEKIRFVIDVQDLWPEAFQMVVNIPLLSDVVFAPFKTLANGIYKRADAICAVSDTYCQRALRVNKKVNTTTTVFLGTELSTFDKFAAENPILEKNADEVWLAYCGTLGSSYDITCVIDAMALLDDSKIRLVVMGDGPRLEEFKEYSINKRIRAEFVGRLQYNQMCSLVSACDIAVNPISHMAAQSIINKHADYAASGISVISTQESDEYRSLIEQYQMGFNCKNNDANDLAEKLKVLSVDKELRLRMGENSRKCVAERFDRKATYKLLEESVLTNRGRRYCGLVKNKGEIWLGYSGTLGTSYNLPLVFEAIRKAKLKNLRFIVMGDGPLEREYRKQAEGLAVIFTGRLPYEQMCGVLLACDIVVNPIIGSSVATIINKHADYAASGKPVINTQRSEEYQELIIGEEMGINCGCNSEDNLRDAIVGLSENIVLRRKMGEHSRSCAERLFDRANTYKLLCDQLS